MEEEEKKKIAAIQPLNKEFRIGRTERWDENTHNVHTNKVTSIY
jgi:hypothetical protein